MSNIRLDLDSPVINGQTLTFKSPTDCSKVTGLIIYYPVDNSTVSTTFQFADAHGNNVGSIDLFAEDALVKVILDTELYKAYVQNADTNAYLEEKFNDIFTLLNKLPNLYIWKHYFSAPNGSGSTSVTNLQIDSGVKVYETISYGIQYASTFESTDEGLSLVNAETLSTSNSDYAEDCEILKGKFIKRGVSINDNYLYLIPDDAVFSITVQGTTSYLTVDRAKRFYHTNGFWVGYVSSLDRNAYPDDGPGETSGYYVYHKRLGD